MTKNRISVLTFVAFAFVTFATPSLAHDTNTMGGNMMNNRQQMNRGAMMGPGYMHNNQMPMTGQGSMMGHGSMSGQMMHSSGGHHSGHGMVMGMGTGSHMQSGMPGGGYGIKAGRELDVEAVRKVLTGRLAWTGNSRLKVGKVEEKDDDTVIAEIVTLDGSLVDRLAVHRRTGAMRRLP